jgi:hypothetical protein
MKKTMNVAERLFLEDVARAGSRAERKLERRRRAAQWRVENSVFFRWPTKREWATHLCAGFLCAVLLQAVVFGVCVALIKLGFSL